MILRWTGHINWFESLYPVPASFGAWFVYSSNFIALTAAVAKDEVAIATGALVSLAAQQMGRMFIDLVVVYVHGHWSYNRCISHCFGAAGVVEEAVTSKVGRGGCSEG